MLISTTWKPRKRNIKIYPKPEWVPDWVYTQAIVAKRNYNENWDFWVWQVSQSDGVDIAVAEDACIRGIQKEINRYKLVYGSKVCQWLEEFLEMGDIFRKVKHPEYLPKLGE